MNGPGEARIDAIVMPDGAELACRRWEVASPRGAVVAVHGIQSHSGWYVGSSAHLARAGYDVTFFDRRGSGLNRWARGDAAGWRVLAGDLRESVDDVRRRLPGVPVHLAAVSWGAKLACATLIESPDLVRSLVLVNPGLVSKIDLGPWVKARVALALLTGPRKSFDIPLGDPHLFTANPERVAWIESDPLSLRRCTARFLRETRRLDRFVRARAGELRTPVLMLLAGRDRIVDNLRTRTLFDRFASEPRKIIEYAAASHTLEFEPDPGPAFEDILRWLGGFRA